MSKEKHQKEEREKLTSRYELPDGRIKAKWDIANYQPVRSGEREFEILSDLGSVIVEFKGASATIDGQFVYDKTFGIAFAMDSLVIEPASARIEGFGRAAVKLFREKLNAKYKIVVVLIQPEAKGFWMKMEREGLITIPKQR